MSTSHVQKCENNKKLKPTLPVLKPKALKPTVFSQPYRPPAIPVKKLKNPPRIKFVKPVRKPSNINRSRSTIKLPNSETFEKKQKTFIEPPTLSKPNFNVRKRYCFPTLQSSSLYYNNQYFNEFKENPKGLFKYLSDSDITSLVNRLSMDNKDPYYNVYHLDTLYNNIDHILFNSYASDTELAYDTNRQHNEHMKRLITSNYKLFINNYFNKTYQNEGYEDMIQESSEPEEFRIM